MKRLSIRISLKEKQEIRRTAKILTCGVSSLTHFSRSYHANRLKNPQLRRRRCYVIAKITQENGNYLRRTSWQN